MQAVYVDFDEEATAKLREKWERWGAYATGGFTLPVSRTNTSVAALQTRLERKIGNSLVTVLLPEFVPAKWWQHLLHNQSSLMLKGALLFKEGSDCDQRALPPKGLGLITTVGSLLTEVNSFSQCYCARFR